MLTLGLHLFMHAPRGNLGPTGTQTKPLHQGRCEAVNERGRANVSSPRPAGYVRPRTAFNEAQLLNFLKTPQKLHKDLF